MLINTLTQEKSQLGAQLEQAQHQLAELAQLNTAHQQQITQQAVQIALVEEGLRQAVMGRENAVLGRERAEQQLQRLQQHMESLKLVGLLMESVTYQC